MAAMRSVSHRGRRGGRLDAAPDIRVGSIYRGTLPFLAADLILIGLLIAFPALALWLPAALRM